MKTCPVNVIELEGAALDWAVAKAEGLKEGMAWGRGTVKDNGFIIDSERGIVALLQPTYDKWVFKCDSYPWRSDQRIWTPTRNGSQGWPILEREGISLRTVREPGHPLDGQWFAMSAEDCGTDWMVHWAELQFGTSGRRRRWQGPTGLVAGLRCHVERKLGPVIDIPEELL